MKSRFIFTLVVLSLTQFVQAGTTTGTVSQEFYYMQVQEPASPEFPMISRPEKHPYKDTIDSFKPGDVEDYKKLLIHSNCAQRIAYGTAVIQENSARLRQLYHDVIVSKYFSNETGDIKDITIVNTMKEVAHKRTDSWLTIEILRSDGSVFEFPRNAESSQAQMEANGIFSNNCEVYTEVQITQLILSALIDLAKSSGNVVDDIANYSEMNLSGLRKWWKVAPFIKYPYDAKNVADLVNFNINLRNKEINQTQQQIDAYTKKGIMNGDVALLRASIQRLKVLNAIEQEVQDENEYVRLHFDTYLNWKLPQAEQEQHQAEAHKLVLKHSTKSKS